MDAALHRMCRVVFMCRRNLIPGAAMLGFGVGILVGMLMESALAHLIVGAAAIGGAIWLLQGRCRS